MAPCTRGECARQAPGFLSCSSQGRHKTQAQLSPSFCGEPENWNHTPCRARSLESSLEPEQYRQGKHPPRVGANPVWPEHCRSSPHTPVTFVCSAPPSPKHRWTREPEQETTSARLCQGGNQTLKRPANRSQINKGNCFRSHRCNRLKFLQVTLTTSEEAYKY